MNPYALLPLSGFVVNLALAASVFARSPRALTNRLYAALALSLAYWCVLKFAWRLTGDEATATILFRASAPGWCSLATLYLHFVLEFTRVPGSPSRKAPLIALHTVGALFAASAFVPGAMLHRMVRAPWGYIHEPGPAYRAFSVFFIVTFLVAVVRLVQARQRARSASMRAQCSYVLVGIAFPLLGGVVTNMLLPMAGIRVLELGEVLSTVNAAVVAYAMVRRGLLAVSLEEAAETIIETMGDSLLVVNRGGDVVLANGAATRLLGFESGEVVGRPVAQFVRSGLFATAADSTQRGLLTEEGAFLTRGGEEVSVLLSLSPVRDPDGVLLGLVLVAKDIREMRRVMDALASANERLELQSITDELTRAANRRAANQRLEMEFKRAIRYGRSLSVAVVDLDEFKAINDTRGHPTGDAVLQAVATAMQASVRATDVVARWGGDEFLAILPECDATAARVASERLLDAIRSAKVDGVVRISASIGVATMDPEHAVADADALIKRADDALYVAKRAGKGQASHGAKEPP